jgi:hypothetical protein
MKKLSLIVLMIILLPLEAYSLTEQTHLTINEEIAKTVVNEFSLDTYLINQLGFSKGILGGKTD